MKIKNSLEIERITDLIKNNILCLSYPMLDAKKITGNTIDEIEQELLNNVTSINLFEAEKEKRTYKRTDYKLYIDVYFNYGESIYRIINWFAYDKNNGILEDTELFADSL